MPQSHSWSISHNLIVLALVLFSKIALASLSLQELQPIARFPASCEAAYQTPIQNCPDASSFSLTGSSSGSPVCTTDCYIALVRAAASIQSACQGSAAPPGTVIAHAFTGDLATWLCGINGGTSSQSSSVTASSTTAPAFSASSSLPGSTASNAGSSTSSNLLSSSSVSNSASSSTSPSISASSSSTLTSLTPTSTSSSTTTTLHKSTRSSSSSSTTSKPEPTLNPGGGGSPFDQTVPNAAPTPVNGQKLISIAVGVAMAVALGS